MQYPHSEVSFSAADGFIIQGAIFNADNLEDSESDLQKHPEHFLIIGSAFGVPYQYYKHVAHYLATQGISVLVFDYRGISHSKKGNMKADDILMQHWGEQDIEAAIQFVKTTYKPKKLHYLGHSAGGQILGLAPSSTEIKSIVIAASGVGSWRLWPGLQKYGLALIWYLVFPVILAFNRGSYFQSKFLGPIPVPKSAVKQWLDWARSEDYLFTPKHKLNSAGYGNIRAKILGITISDDWYAPKEARDGLLRHYNNSQQKVLNITPNSIGLKSIGHFGLFKKKREMEQGIWQPIVNFIKEKE